MRWMALGLVVLMAVPVALAQTVILEDGSGDVQLGAGGAALRGIEAVDLRSLSIEEQAERFIFTLGVESLETIEDDGSYRELNVEFAHLDQPYRLQFFGQGFGASSQPYFARFQSFDPGRNAFIQLGSLPVDTDMDAATLTVELDRAWLVDGNGTAPTIGRSLERFRSTSWMAGYFGATMGTVEGRDAMPDDGIGIAQYEIQQGLAQSGQARLVSDNPVRASNGEKAVFVFYVEAENGRDQAQRFDLSTRDVPEGWEITLPASTVRVDANDSRAFPVLVSVPFAHQHGAFEHFVLEMRGKTFSEDIGRIQLGIRYLAVPQPAGHHDTLYIHSRTEPGGFFEEASGEPRIIGYFNTLEDDDNDEGEAIPVRSNFVNGGGRYMWRFFLEPGLEMGLDFDINRTGVLSLNVGAQNNINSYALSGRLVYAHLEFADDGSVRDAREMVVANIIATPAKPLSTSTNFEALIEPTREGDLVEFRKHQFLYLELQLDRDAQGALGTSATDPYITGGEFTLPLNEYRDRIEGVFNSLAGLSFRHESPPEKRVNPGETRLFNLTLTNDGALDDVFDLQLNGTNVAWARLLGDQQISVPTSSERSVVVAVTAPDDAPDGDIVDLIVSAVSQAEPTVQGHIRVVAIVDANLDHPDESNLILEAEDRLTGKKKSPGLPVVMLLGALLLARRRC